MKLFSLHKFPVENKTVLLRVDYNVSLEKNKILEDYKIKETLPTIKFLLEKKCKIILLTHLGRPQGKVVEELRLEPLAKELKKSLPNTKVHKLNDCLGKTVQKTIATGKTGEIFLLENLRFYPEEEENDLLFAQSLAQLGELYINDAFGVSHRAHASVDAITKFLPAIAGFLMEKEIFHLSQALVPEEPVVWIMGGAKLDKVELMQQALRKADYLLIGGALAFPFLRAQGIKVGHSKIDAASITIAQEMLETNREKIILPLDFVVCEDFSARAPTQIVPFNQVAPQQIALDLGPQTIKLFKQYLRKARTIIWNGPLGYFEWAQFANATKEIGRALGNLTATSIVGGGETVSAIRKFHLEHNITHLSTGGGASLEFLAGKKLPGIVALEENYKKFVRKIE